MTITIGQVDTKQPGLFSLIDDWLKRDRFVFVGWSGLLLFPWKKHEKPVSCLLAPVEVSRLSEVKRWISDSKRG